MLENSPWSLPETATELRDIEILPSSQPAVLPMTQYGLALRESTEQLTAELLLAVRCEREFLQKHVDTWMGRLMHHLNVPDGNGTDASTPKKGPKASDTLTKLMGDDPLPVELTMETAASPFFGSASFASSSQDSEETTEEPSETNVRELQAELEFKQRQLHTLLRDWARHGDEVLGKLGASKQQLNSVKKLQQGATTDLEEKVESVEKRKSQVPTPSELEAFEAFEKEKQTSRSSLPSRRITRLQRLVFSNNFDVIWGAAIVANALVIGAEVEYKTVYPQTHAVFIYLQYIFCIAFFTELIMRLYANGVRRHMCGRDRVWNILDVTMVIISVIEVVDTLTTHVNGEEQKSGGPAAILRIARMARLIRIVRVLRFSPQLRVLLFMIFESIKSLGWLMCILAVILYIFSICFTMAATEYLGPEKVPMTPTPVGDKEVARYFGTVIRSVYSCFKAMTGGQSWGEMLDPLVDVNTMYALLFLFYVSFSVLALLNVVTGVFVDGALAKSANDRDFVVEKELSHKKACVANLKELFDETDSDGSGMLTVDEFMARMSDSKIEAYLAHLQVDTTDVQGLFHQLDEDDSGAITIDEFVANLLLLMRGQTLEQVVQKLSGENRRLTNLFIKFSEYSRDQFNEINKQLGSKSTPNGEKTICTPNGTPNGEKSPCSPNEEKRASRRMSVKEAIAALQT